LLCDNCKKREANIRYSENINGRKREMNLCEICSEKLGIRNINVNMPIDFASLLGDFFEDLTRPEIMPTLFEEIRDLKCDNCGYTFEDITNIGKFGCESCYETFENRIDPILKRIQGSNRHIGRIGKDVDNKLGNQMRHESKIQNKTEKQNNTDIPKLEKLKEDLKQAIKEERYEDAVKIRDEIKKLET